VHHDVDRASGHDNRVLLERTDQIAAITPQWLALRERARFYVSGDLEGEIFRRAGEQRDVD